MKIDVTHEGVVFISHIKSISFQIGTIVDQFIASEVPERGIRFDDFIQDLEFFIDDYVFLEEPDTAENIVSKIVNSIAGYPVWVDFSQ